MSRRTKWSSPERLIPLTLPLVLLVLLWFVFLIIPELDAPSRTRPHEPQGPAHDAAVPNAARKEAIRSAFRFAWDGYHKIAFPHDELRPLTNTAGTSRNDWGASAIDALGTAILMEQHDTVRVIIEHVKTLDFTRAEDGISVFETTIRYLGGLLSAYELLDGPFASVKPAGMNTELLLQKAAEVGEMLTDAFLPNSTLPSQFILPNMWVGDGATGLAVAGTMVLEWTKLSDLTGNSTYAFLSQRAEDVLLHPKYSDREVFPGLLNQDIDMRTQEVEPSIISWGGSSDSFYEYLIKFYAYDPKSFDLYRSRWELAADSTLKHFVSVPRGLPDLLFLAHYRADINKLVPESAHLVCFAGGNFLLAGQILANATYTQAGLKLVDGCHHVYATTTAHIGPESWYWVPTECDSKADPPWDCQQPPAAFHDFYEKSHTWSMDTSYNLRPETIESYYYAYRMTKDPKYRDWAWDAWVAINTTARMEYGYNYLTDVMAEDGGKNVGDNQESYFFSETLKYLFLIFDDDEGEWHVNNKMGRNDWIFTTEGHLLKARS